MYTFVHRPFEVGLAFTRTIVRGSLESGGWTSEELRNMVLELGPDLHAPVDSSWVYYCSGMVSVAAGLASGHSVGDSPVGDPSTVGSYGWLISILVDLLEGVLKDCVHLACLRRQLMVGGR